MRRPSLTRSRIKRPPKTVFSFQFAANTFADVDVGDSLTYTASGVPGWLSFDAATRTFSGTPANADVGTVTSPCVPPMARVLVEDSSTSRSPIATMRQRSPIRSPIRRQPKTRLQLHFPGDTFADLDLSDSLTYTASGLPGWLSFDAATRTFSGTPGNADVETATVTVRPPTQLDSARTSSTSR